MAHTAEKMGRSLQSSWHRVTQHPPDSYASQHMCGQSQLDQTSRHTHKHWGFDIDWTRIQKAIDDYIYMSPCE